MSVFTERVGLELLLLVQGLPSSLLEKIKTKKERESSHPTCRILHSAPGSITWPQWNPPPRLHPLFPLLKRL